MIRILLFVYGVMSMGLPELSQILYGREYKGQWIGHGSQQQFEFLTEVTGDTFMIFLQESGKQDSSDNLIERMEFELLNPTYPELKQVVGLFPLEAYNAETMVWAGEGIMNYTNVYKYRRQHTSKDECMVQYLVNVEFDGESQTASNAKIQLAIKSKSDTCVVDFQVTYRLDTTNYLLEIIMYCVFSMAICFVEFLCVTKLCKSLLENEQDVSKISLISVGYVTVYDSYICLQNLYFALINYSYFQYFILPAFFYFMLATTCDMKLIWIIWRSRHMNDLFDQQQMRKAITIFFAQFYFSLIAYFILMYFFELDDWFICITGMLMLPQIIHNARGGNNPKFISYYIFGILCPSVFYPIYARGCPSNLRGMQPSYTFCFVFASLYLMQVVVLYVQFKLGPRSFIPKCLLPKPFQYYHVINIQDNDEEMDECAICLTSLIEEPGDDNQDASAKLLVKQIMITPCKHQFHVSCLKSWIDIKMQCPTCRATIPALPE